jgi:AraC-like DNA-binding protein
MELELRQVFRPVQPTVKPTDEAVQYREALPDARLSQFIYCYWRLRTSTKLPLPFTYRVIPDGCIDIFFDVTNPVTCRVMGFSTSHTVFTLGTTFDYVGVRFLPMAFSNLFKCNAAALTDKDESFFDIDLQATSALVERLEGVFEFEKIKEVFNHFFIEKISQSKYSFDNRLSQAIWEISRTHGGLRFKTDIDTGISPRQLRRLFEFHVGTSPKMFSKVVRFQYFFQLLTSSQKDQHNRLFFDAGYYDQPHFHRDFKSFSGVSPSVLLKA